MIKIRLRLKLNLKNSNNYQNTCLKKMSFNQMKLLKLQENQELQAKKRFLRENSKKYFNQSHHNL
jgi:hypothetical protein